MSRDRASSARLVLVALLAAAATTALALIARPAPAGGAEREAAGDDAALRRQAAEALRRAVTFSHREVSSHGGYVYRYSADLARREGEGKVGPDTAWVQPPGTPAVGLAYLDAYERLREPYLLDAARAAGECLVRGQLRSGGWTARIEFATDERAKLAYRVDGDENGDGASRAGRKRKKRFNWSSFDDDQTQSAVRFMCRLDRATGFKDQTIHEAALFALDSVLAAQFPNGGWAQGFDGPVNQDLDKYPVRPATYPPAWPRQHPGGDYWVYYTLNDDAVADTIDALLLAADVYGDDPRYRAAALRGGEFLLLAQMPEPQPAWAQQYDFDMRPVWARKFEPPAISGGESQAVLRTLLDLYVETGDRRFLEPVPKALAYLRRSALPDGRLARFYELEANRPLYFTRQYELTHDDGDVPTHYSFKVDSKLDSIEKEYERLTALSEQELAGRRARRVARRAGTDEAGVPSDDEVRAVIDALDERGAWVEDGRLEYHGKGDDTRRVIESATFIRNVGVLARYLAADVSSEK